MTQPDGSVFPIDVPTELPAAAGGKAHGLRSIVQTGLAMPPAWAVLPGAADGALTALASHLAAGGVARVAVRSSAQDEDGGAHSFAGIHETALAVPLDLLAEVIAAVAASPLSDRARAYRVQRGLPPPAGPAASSSRRCSTPTGRGSPSDAATASSWRPWRGSASSP